MRPLDINASGLVSNVGLCRSSTLAAYRAQLANFNETRFKDKNGEWLLGAEIPLELPVRGKARLIELAAAAVEEALDEMDDTRENRKRKDIPLLLCLACAGRKGQVITDPIMFFSELKEKIGMTFSEESQILQQGKISVSNAIAMAESLLYDHRREYVLVVGVDTLLTAKTLKAYDDASMLFTRTTSNGFIPGEGAACIVLGKASTDIHGSGSRLLGTGHGAQPKRKSNEEPLKADGMISAIQMGLASANIPMSAISFWFYDNDVAYQSAKEATLTELRLLRGENIIIERMSPISVFGETGVVSLFIMLVLFPMVSDVGVRGLLTAISDETDQRVALVLQNVCIN